MMTIMEAKTAFNAPAVSGAIPSEAAVASVVLCESVVGALESLVLGATNAMVEPAVTLLEVAPRLC